MMSFIQTLLLMLAAPITWSWRWLYSGLSYMGNFFYWLSKPRVELNEKDVLKLPEVYSESIGRLDIMAIMSGDYTSPTKGSAYQHIIDAIRVKPSKVKEKIFWPDLRCPIKKVHMLEAKNRYTKLYLNLYFLPFPRLPNSASFNALVSVKRLTLIDYRHIPIIEQIGFSGVLRKDVLRLKPGEVFVCPADYTDETCLSPDRPKKYLPMILVEL